VFGPAWTTLYVMMAVAAWMVWRQGGWAGSKAALALFAVQLILNAGWSLLFFGLHSPGAAAVELAMLWLAILATTLAFWKQSHPAAVLMVPYLAWTTFAGALNVAIWRMNG
jgi:tryptophan-rich sensory protein